jgi:zinc transporter ZupT
MLHLLADAVNELGEYFEYPLGLALAAAGAMFTLGLHLVASDCSPTAPIISPIVINTTIDSDVCGNIELMVEQEKSVNNARAVILEGCVTVHSILIGYDYGLQSSNSGGSMIVLMVALCIHQFFEGLSVGTAFVECMLPSRVSAASASIFAVGLPAGVVLGMLHQDDSATGIITAGCANAIAAGSLMFASMTEMIGHDFFARNLDGRPLLKLQMYTSLVAGFVAMAALAILA